MVVVVRSLDAGVAGKRGDDAVDSVDDIAAVIVEVGVRDLDAVDVQVFIIGNKKLEVIDK